MYVHIICNSIIQILAYIRIEIVSPAIIFITCAYKHDTAALQHIKQTPLHRGGELSALSYTAYGGHATVSGPAHTMQISGDT